MANKKNRAARRRKQAASKKPSAQSKSYQGSPGQAQEVATTPLSDKSRGSKHGPDSSHTSKKKKVSRAKSADLVPVTAEGSLDWRQVRMPRVSPDNQSRFLPQAVLADQEVPLMAGALAVFCFFGIAFTARWSPVLLAVLVLAALLDRRMRDNSWVLLQALVASLASLACWPLIADLLSRPSSRLGGDGGQPLVVSLVTLLTFVVALWLTGGITRMASLLHGQPLLRSGLYAVGVGCQALAVLVLMVGGVMAIGYFNVT